MTLYDYDSTSEMFKKFDKIFRKRHPPIPTYQVTEGQISQMFHNHRPGQFPLPNQVKVCCTYIGTRSSQCYIPPKY